MSDAVNASAPEKLSDRIAALEQRVVLGQQARNKANELEQSIEELNIRLISCRAQAKEGDHAQRILDHLSETAERIIAGGEVVPAADTELPSAEAERVRATMIGVDLPEPHESSEPHETAPQTELQAHAVAEPETASAVAESHSKSEEAPPAPQAPSVQHVSQYQQMLNHIATLEPTENFDKDSLASELGFVVGSIRKYLYRAETEGHVVKYVVGDTEGPNVYRRRVGSAAEVAPTEPQDPLPQPTPAASSIQPEQASNAVSIKPPAVPEQRSPRDIPPLTTRKVVASNLMCEQVLGILIRQGRPMNLSMIVNRASGLKQAEVQAALEGLKSQGKVQLNEYGFWLTAS